MDNVLIEKWIEYHSTNNKELYWAWEQLNEIVHNSPKEAFEYILAISQLTSNQQVISNLGAGPLEDFLVLYGPDYIEQVEAKARQVPGFTNVVSCVWKNNINSSVWERINAINTKHS